MVLLQTVAVAMQSLETTRTLEEADMSIIEVDRSTPSGDKRSRRAGLKLRAFAIPVAEVDYARTFDGDWYAAYPIRKQTDRKLPS
jgi:hypothetical protein